MKMWDICRKIGTKREKKLVKTGNDAKLIESPDVFPEMHSVRLIENLAVFRKPATNL